MMAFAGFACYGWLLSVAIFFYTPLFIGKLFLTATFSAGLWRFKRKDYTAINRSEDEENEKNRKKTYEQDEFFKLWLNGLSPRTKENYTQGIHDWIVFVDMNPAEQVKKRMDDLTTTDITQRQYFEDKFRAYKRALMRLTNLSQKEFDEAIKTLSDREEIVEEKEEHTRKGSSAVYFTKFYRWNKNAS